MVQSQRLDRISGQSQPIQTSLLPSIPLVPKTSRAPTKQQVFFLGQNTFHTQFKIPRNIMHELPHNHSKNPIQVHPLPCVGSYIKTCNNFRHFPDILSTTKVLWSRFFSFSLLDQILLLPIYNNPKSKSNHIFVQSSLQAQSFSFPLITLKPLAFISLTCLQSSSSSHLFASPRTLCQSPSKNLIHIFFKAFSLGYRYCIPFQQLTPFVMTYRATKKKHQKQKYIKSRFSFSFSF